MTQGEELFELVDHQEEKGISVRFKITVNKQAQSPRFARQVIHELGGNSQGGFTCERGGQAFKWVDSWG